MDVSLDRETEKLVQSEIASGRFQTADALIRTALKHFLIARELGEEYTAQEIEEKIANGMAQLDRGESVDGEEFFARLRVRGEELRQKHG